MSNAEIADDILQRWHESAKYYWDDTSSNCAKCHAFFLTGEVCLVFGDLDYVIVKTLYMCATCGVKHIEAGNAPTSTALFIEEEHRDKKLTELPDAVRDHVLEAFALIEQLHENMEKAALEPIARSDRPIPTGGDN